MSKRIEVSLAKQKLVAYDGPNVAFDFTCATGDSDNPTTPGVFRVFKKDRFHFSKKYQAQMDFAMFFDGGKAIHMSHMVAPVSLLKRIGIGYFGSHGCVRLAEEDAAALFQWTPMGTQVKVV